MQSRIEGVIKLLLVASLVLAGLAVWLVPKTRFLRHRQISERVFIATQIIGIVCGAGGLVLLFAWPQRVLEWHLWEATVMPYALVYFYWMIVMRRSRRLDIVDEKQGFNMAAASGLAMAPTVLAMLVAFDLHGRGLFDASLWFPYFLLVTILSLSASTLFCFKRG